MPIVIIYNYIMTNYESDLSNEIYQASDQLAHLFSISANMRDR
ncbi:hypothetical protein SK629_1077 [Streptococcus mitis]|uniref:Uncharacterized protein n=1 Tax=Streptococcus mitis TaxID=28037 RepID=A0A081PXZ3_STRMT|nr:hypothetical protein SK629_1077 [Streptococcus mitis]